MSELIVYLLIDILMVLLVLPWLMIIAIPMLMISLGLAIVVYVPIMRFTSPRIERVGFRVLLVDDSPNTLMLIKSILASRNYVLKTVDNGLKAVEELSREKYDLMVLDYFMPGLNGSETLNLADQAINEKLSTKSDYQVPVIEYSSCQEGSIKTSTMNHFTLIGKLSKGLPPSVLRPMISQILEEASV